jgi:hypothetical protein
MCTVHWKNRLLPEKERQKSTNGRKEKLDRNSEAASGAVFRNSK